MSSFFIRPETRDIFFDFMSVIRPEYEELEKVEALKKIYMPLRLHEIPLGFSLFLFELALEDMQKAIALRKVLFDKENRHWLEAIFQRLPWNEESMRKVITFIVKIPKSRRYEI